MAEDDLLTFQPVNDTLEPAQPVEYGLPPAPASPPSIFSLKYYSAFFNVDTSDVIHRAAMALNPLNRSFLGDIPVPDLYGPVWLSVTGPFVMMVFGNLSGWLSKRDEWSYSFYPFVVALALTVAFVFGVPFAFYWATKNLQSPSTMALVCLFGYATVFMVPTALACLVFRRVGLALAAIGGLASAISLFNKLNFEFQQHGTGGFALVPNILASLGALAVILAAKILLFR